MGREGKGARELFLFLLVKGQLFFERTIIEYNLYSGMELVLAG